MITLSPRTAEVLDERPKLRLDVDDPRAFGLRVLELAGLAIDRLVNANRETNDVDPLRRDRGELVRSSAE